jgi:hypothetical protein
LNLENHAVFIRNGSILIKLNYLLYLIEKQAKGYIHNRTLVLIGPSLILKIIFKITKALQLNPNRNYSQNKKQKWQAWELEFIKRERERGRERERER